MDSVERQSEATTAAEAAVAAAETAFATGTLFARPGFIDHEFAAALLGAVDRFDRGVGFIGVGHFDEAETFGAAGVAIGDQTGAADRTMRAERGVKVGFGHRVRHVSHIDIHSVFFPAALSPAFFGRSGPFFGASEHFL